MVKKIYNIWKILGPGMLYAGAAVGVSHLVQSTRAGSDYGWSLWWIILFANFIKYPFFEFGPRYVAATGQCLLYGYKSLGRFSLLIYLTMTLLTMFAIQAAVTIVTAGLMENIFHFQLSAPLWSVILLLGCGAILTFESYKLLNDLVKYIILILSISTVASLVLAPVADVVSISREAFSWSDKKDLFFLVALVGWMPAPIDISVWHSGWALAHEQAKNERTTFKHQMIDFNVGYIGTALLALCFLGLGALVMYPTGKVFPGDAIGFTKELILLFTQSLGAWSYPLILGAAFFTMLSTTLTLLDAFPRTLRRSFEMLLDRSGTPKEYRIWLVVVMAGTSALLLFFIDNMRTMVDLATSISFVVAPVLALLNTMVILDKKVPSAFSPPLWLKLHAFMGLAFLTAFSGYFIWLRFFS
jgi:Mn2+/Fe2+ NRAMP family transporter